MQSESLSARDGFATVAWQRTRAALPASTLWAAAIVFLLVLVISRSTVAASWVVDGINTAPLVALAGAALMGILAVTPIPWYWCVAVGLALGPVVAAVDSAPVFRALHADDPAGLALVQTWLQRIQSGSAFGESDFVLFVIVWLMWVTGAWLAWSVLRWRQPLIGLIPGAAAFATNVLNYPDNQNGFTLGFLVLTFALLLWTNYTGSIAKAMRARVKLTGDAKWDFWESGLVATAALIVLGIMLPPLSTVDRTATMESSLFNSWALIQQQLNHPSDNALTSGVGGPGTTGFSEVVRLSPQLKKSNSQVFTYTYSGTYIGPRYFRGVSVLDPVNGVWKYADVSTLKQALPRDTAPEWAELYQNETFATFSVNFTVPPQGDTDVIFYPGQLDRIDRDTTENESYNPGPSGPGPLVTIDKLQTVKPPTSRGGYNVTVMYPNAFEAELRAAGNDYPSWLVPFYTTLPPTGYRDPSVLAMEEALAHQITDGATNDYDKATAIQNYFRQGKFTYTLDPGPLPPGETDYMHYFLTRSFKGFCEYFATAMADMLRLLGIPSRLVNGYGQGAFQSQYNRYTVTSADAHTWVEVYFPNFGWIPFEPTPDLNYSPITRGHTTGTGVCVSDTNCPGPTGTTGGGGPTPLPNQEGGRVGGAQSGGANSGGAAGGFKIGVPDAGTLTKVLAVLIAVMLLVAAYVSRYLRPRSVMGVWQRTLLLARLAGAAVAPGETPFELGRRLARLFPEAETPVRALAGGFAVAAYAPPEVAEGVRGNIFEAWAQLRPLMLKRVATRLRPTRR